MKKIREEKVIEIMKEKYEKIKKKAEKQRQKWQFIINSENKNQLLNKSLDVMNFGGTTGNLVANQFVIGIDNESKNFYVFSEQNSSIVGYAIFKLPFSYLDGVGEVDGDEHWLKITEHKPETVERKLRKVERYIKMNKNKEEAKDIRMYKKWKKKRENN